MIDRDAALHSLPHGAEFRFVDRILELDPGVSATAIYHVRGDEEFLKGHFPNRPMIPGVILVEALAQVGGMISQTAPDTEPAADLRLAAIRSAKILGTAVPGDTITIVAELRGRLDTLVQVSGSVKNGDTVILEAQVTLAGV